MNRRNGTQIYLGSIVVLWLVVYSGCNATRNIPPKLLTENKMAVVNGKASFLLGLYENPKDDARLKEAIEAGFNVIRSSADKKELDRLHNMGAKAWINLGSNLDLSKDREPKQTKLLKIVNELKDHPALLIWEGPDEILWNNWWIPHSYLCSKEFPEMEALSQQNPELRPIYNQVTALNDRALRPEMDKARRRFWERSGKEMPRPELRFAEIKENVRQTGLGLAEGVKIVRQADPKHIVWFNHAPRNSVADLTFYNRAVDMAGCDIYPVTAQVGHSDLPNTLLSSVGDYTDRMQQAAKNKACAMVLQGFGFWDLPSFRKSNSYTPEIGRRPTFKESRFMAYDAIVHGANAIMYWGTHYVKDKKGDEETQDTQLWRDLLNIIRQLRALEPVLASRAVVPSPNLVLEQTFSSAEAMDIPLMLKKSGGDYVLIIVNESPGGISFSVNSLPAELEGRKLYRLGATDTVTVKNGAFRDGIPRFDAYVYATSRRFEASR